MLMQVQRTIDENTLIQKGDKVLVALSGGADSVCLLDVLLCLKDSYGITLAAAHLHHGLRGEEADRDEAFCRDFCEKRNIDFYSFDVYALDEAKKTSQSLETVA